MSVMTRASAENGAIERLGHGSRHCLDVVLLHARMQRQGELTARELFGQRQWRAGKILPVVGGLMDRRVMDGGLNFGFAQFVDDPLPIDLLG